jgi:hypothetical protein
MGGWKLSVKHVGLALLAVWLASGAQEEPTQPNRPARISSHEQLLWHRITTLTRPVPKTEPYEAHFAAAQERCRNLLVQLRQYLLLYPGGVHRDEAIRLELETLFESGTLRGGDLTALCQRVEEVLAERPSAQAVHEAAYWEIVCRRWRADDQRLPDMSPGKLDDDLRSEYRQYVRRYPDSPYVPRLATLLFEDAAARHNREQMLAALNSLRAAAPNHPATEVLEGMWRREAAIEYPFCLTQESVDGEWIDTRTYRGQPVVVVVWAGYDQSACDCVRQIEQFRRARPELRVVGLNLDADVGALRAATEELGITWPQIYDGLVWGGEFVRHWGVRRIPCVFVVDREGRLVGTQVGPGWEELVRAAEAGFETATSTQPGASAGGKRAPAAD